MEGARKMFYVFRYESDKVRTSAASYGKFGKQVDYRHHTHQMENNIYRSVIANMTNLRKSEVIFDKIKVHKTYTDPMLFLKKYNTATTIVINKTSLVV
jgi:hypothetical protein